MTMLTQPAIRHNRHEDGQTENSEGKISRPRRPSDRKLRSHGAAVLGADMPGSEGNLASDLENQDQAAVAAPTEEENADSKSADSRTPDTKTQESQNDADGRPADQKTGEPKL